MNLQSLFDNLITGGLKLSDPTAARKIKVLNIFQLVFIMLAPLLGLFYFYVGAILLFYIIIAAGLLMIPSVMLLRKTKNVLWVSNYAIFILWATLLILSWSTGAMTSEGVMKPSWLLNGGLIFLAIFLNGNLWGMVWALLIFVQTCLVIYLFHVGYPFPNLIPAEISEAYSFGTLLMALLTIFLFAFLFGQDKSEALNREQERSRALKEFKKYVDDILARSPIPTFILDREHRVVQWNRACEEMTGIPAEEILGKEAWEGFTTADQRSLADILLEDPDFVTEAYGDFIKSGTESGWYELEMLLPRMKGGLRALITAAPILDSNGEVKGAIQTVQELGVGQNDSSIVYGALDQTEESWANPIFKIDSKGKISFWNKACEGSFGYSSSQMLGKSPLTILSKRYRTNFKKMIIRVFKGESFSSRQWKFYNKEGEPVYVLARVFPLETSKEKDKECVIVSTNITDLKLRMKELEADVLESKEELRNLSEEYDLLKKNIATFLRGKEKFDRNL